MRMSNSAFASVFAVAAILAASASPAEAQLIKLGPKHAEGKDPVHFTPGAHPELVFIANPENIKGLKKVAIPYFQVQFITNSRAVAGRATAKAAMSYDLQGVGAAEMQKITDDLYAKFVADLGAAGLTIMGQDEARAASPAYNKLAAAGAVSPSTRATANGTTSIFCAPAAAPIYFHVVDSQFTNISNLASSAHMDERRAVKELQAALVGVRLVVNFVDLEANNSTLGRMSGTARVKSSVSISVEAGDSNLWVITPASRQSMSYPVERLRYEVAAPLMIADDAILAVQDTTSAGSKAGDAALGALSLLAGGSGYNSTTKAYTVIVDRAAYVRGVGVGLRGVEEMLVSKLRTGL